MLKQIEQGKWESRSVIKHLGSVYGETEKFVREHGYKCMRWCESEKRDVEIFQISLGRPQYFNDSGLRYYVESPNN